MVCRRRRKGRWISVIFNVLSADFEQIIICWRSIRLYYWQFLWLSEYWLCLCSFRFNFFFFTVYLLWALFIRVKVWRESVYTNRLFEGHRYSQAEFVIWSFQIFIKILLNNRFLFVYFWTFRPFTCKCKYQQQPLG